MHLNVCHAPFRIRRHIVCSSLVYRTLCTLCDFGLIKPPPVLYMDSGLLSHSPFQLLAYSRSVPDSHTKIPYLCRITTSIAIIPHVLAKKSNASAHLGLSLQWLHFLMQLLPSSYPTPFVSSWLIKYSTVQRRSIYLKPTGRLSEHFWTISYHYSLYLFRKRKKEGKNG